MIRRSFASALFATLLLVGLGPSSVFGGTFVWTGVSGTGWRGNVIVPSDGTADLILGKAINTTIPLGADTFINSITLTGNESYLFEGGSPLTLTFNNNAGNGIFGALGSFSRIVFDSSVDIAGTGALKMDAGDGYIVVNAAIVGTADLYLSNGRGGTNGAFIFNNTGSGSSYTGNTFITGLSGTPVVVAFWNSQPFGDGTGTLNIQNSAALIAHGSQTVGNAIVFNTTTANDPVSFKSWDDTLTFSGDVTLAKNTTLNAQRAQPGVPSNDNTGIFPTPGAFTRHAIVFSGDIGESGGANSLTIQGPGVVVLTGSNSYTGGTNVSAGGSLVFASASSVPTVGIVTSTMNGYVGFGDTTSGEFANFLANFVHPVSPGAVGIDTLPGNSTVTFSDAIDLSGFLSPNIRIGTATSAILTGTITPQGTNYLFGSGGGTLYVQSDFTDLGTSNLILNNGNPTAPLTLFLQNAPNYLGNTVAGSGFIIFDGYFLPTIGQLRAAGSSINIGASYIGMTNYVDATPDDLLNAFDKTNTWGIIGFDTHAGDPTFDVTYNLDLSGFNNGVYLGTATSAILSGILTPTADGILRVTAGRGGILEIDSTLGPGSLSPGVNELWLGTPAPTDVYSNGIVRLPFANTYAGGTTFNSTVGGITVEAGDDNSFGTGTIRLPQDVIAGLQASRFVTLANTISFDTPAAMHAPGSLFLQGGVIFEISGSIVGPGNLNIMDPLNFPYVILSGDNSAFSGEINLYAGYLQLAHNNATGSGTLNFLSGGILRLDSVRAPAPVIYGIRGDNGTIELNDFDALTFDLSNPLNSHEFGGTIGNESAPNATITITSTVTNDALYLSGYSNYSGGTIILDHGAVGVGNASALGTGLVTLNAPQGGLAVNVGVTLTNDLALTAGSLQGFGTFAPNSVDGMSGAPITITSGLSVAPGLYGLSNNKTTGTLTFATGADFGNGGRMLWSIQDAGRIDGYSSLLVDGGNLNISASLGNFTLFLASLDASGAPGMAANFTLGTPMTFTIATVLSGFSLTGPVSNIAIDTSLFANSVTNVTLTSDATNLYLTFTPVPEPSTYALLGLGLSALVLPALRRRKRV